MSSDSKSDNKSDNKRIVHRYIEQVWQKRNPAAIDDYIAADYVQHAQGAPPGREGLKTFFGMLNQAFSDVDYRVEDMIAEDDKVCWRWMIGGKHTGTFQGLPASGHTFTLTGMSIVRLTQGQFAEHWGEQDMAGLMRQLSR